jgi:hypothetical protein
MTHLPRSRVSRIISQTSRCWDFSTEPNRMKAEQAVRTISMSLRWIPKLSSRLDSQSKPRNGEVPHNRITRTDEMRGVRSVLSV